MHRFRTTNLNQIVQAASRLKQDDADLPMVLELAEDWLSRLKTLAQEVLLWLLSRCLCRQKQEGAQSPLQPQVGLVLFQGWMETAWGGGHDKRALCLHPH